VPLILHELASVTGCAVQSSLSLGVVEIVLPNSMHSEVRQLQSGCASMQCLAFVSGRLALRGLL
jgi:hypothetical protein